MSGRIPNVAMPKSCCMNQMVNQIVKLPMFLYFLGGIMVIILGNFSAKMLSNHGNHPVMAEGLCCPF